MRRRQEVLANAKKGVSQQKINELSCETRQEIKGEWERTEKWTLINLLLFLFLGPAAAASFSLGESCALLWEAEEDQSREQWEQGKRGDGCGRATNGGGKKKDAEELIMIMFWEKRVSYAVNTERKWSLIHRCRVILFGGIQKVIARLFGYKLLQDHRVTTGGTGGPQYWVPAVPGVAGPFQMKQHARQCKL